MDQHTVKNDRVTCLDISQDAGVMISGYKNGSLALWDLIEYKLLKFVPGLHSSDVTNTKIFGVQGNGSTVSVLSSEDKGAVRITEIHKKPFFGGYSVNSEFLFNSRIRGTTAIELYE